MSPKLLKAIAGAIVAAATSLEISQILPVGTATAVGGFLTYLVGLYHPQPQGK